MTQATLGTAAHFECQLGCEYFIYLIIGFIGVPTSIVHNLGLLAIVQIFIKQSITCCND